MPRPLILYLTPHRDESQPEKQRLVRENQKWKQTGKTERTSDSAAVGSEGVLCNASTRAADLESAGFDSACVPKIK